MSVRVIFADDALIVVDKPAGLLSVPGRGSDKHDCVAARMQALHPDALVVHRLDMATSGLMLMARGAEAQRRLSVAFAQRAVHKRYVAEVHGALTAEAGKIDLPLGADWPNRPRQQVDRERGRPSLTRYRVLSIDAARQRSRLSLEPVTGRSHQVRVHLQAIGHPIVGDALYGAADERLMLHASELRLAHPFGGQGLHLRSDPPF
ncbi:RluA family pseudouridine synthase [Piscinibacter sp. XHJ-5]|uniref:RluA family pseudouridine synthase n=1 Tax=Piscinibacter sp. XHJ-5 TaxID=3037797 RepID=UPI002453622C|nr:RluA family pseudouridine synthase [Piscinibacter sp. XHJ-5]